MADRTDWRISSILRDSVDKFEEHSGRIGKILDETRDRFNKDYTGYAAAACTVLTISSVGLAPFGVAPAVCVTGIVVGGIGLVSSLVLRHLNGNAQVSSLREMTDLERERSRFALRAATLQQIWLHGLPEGTPLAQIQVLLGDPPTASQASDAALTWKALPKPEEDEQGHAS